MPETNTILGQAVEIMTLGAASGVMLYIVCSLIAMVIRNLVRLIERGE